ncbi:response regulator transcription factor [Anaerotalea alkaliphila]|uniref:Stage 0 sporulation protein A homolog n=1 Tax=Anaerotalea alkaliphila TaxID=2662126 RepID=A0A7X5HX94_9FIRM|nr:AraC family transcriptional regulator [Anaerotalea alkaliphila]NDL68303.1 AraC family transcriptional regulator [Anaerotalea alkaliphila]
MFSVLIAEDEKIEREALVHIISRSSLPLKEVVQAANGPEAVSVASVVKPEIVLMDIRMPGMDGIEASRIIKKIDPGCKIVLLTAFEQFSYAQEAIKIGVEDYLVKPASNERVLEVLEKVIGKLEQEKALQSKSQALEQKVNQIGQYLEREFVGALVAGDLEEDQAKETLRFMAGSFEEGFGACIRLQARTGKQVPKMQSDMMKKRVLDGLRSSTLGRYCKFYCGDMQQEIHLLVYGYPEGSQEMCMRKLEEETARILEGTGSFRDLEAVIGFGAPCGRLSRMWTSFAQARSACHPRGGKPVAGPDEARTTGDAVANDLRELELEKAKGKADIYLESLPWQEGDDGLVQLQLDLFWKALAENLWKSEGMVLAVPGFRDGSGKAPTKAEARGILYGMLLEAAETLEDRKGDRTMRILQQAVGHMRQNYSQNITLEAMASLCNFSIYHFSKVFKKHYGTSFSDYLTAIRMEAAKNLLRDLEVNIKEVCVRTGYGDPNYFARAFRKYTGLSPSEYRNRVGKV